MISDSRGTLAEQLDRRLQPRLPRVPRLPQCARRAPL
jgi:hypothetical protein